jgi:hypothetical protein
MRSVELASIACLPHQTTRAAGLHFSLLTLVASKYAKDMQSSSAPFRCSVGLGLAFVMLGSPANGVAKSSMLPRANIVLPNAVSVDVDAQAVTLPLHRGTAQGSSVWYSVTDSSDRADATARNRLCAEACRHGCGMRVVRSSRRRERRRNRVQCRTGLRPVTRVSPGPERISAERGRARFDRAECVSPFIRVAPQAATINAPIIATGAGPVDVVSHADTLDRVGLDADATLRNRTRLHSSLNFLGSFPTGTDPGSGVELSSFTGPSYSCGLTRPKAVAPIALV